MVDGRKVLRIGWGGRRLIRIVRRRGRGAVVIHLESIVNSRRAVHKRKYDGMSLPIIVRGNGYTIPSIFFPVYI